MLLNNKINMNVTMKRVFVLFLFSMMMLYLPAQNSQITLHIEGFGNKQVVLEHYSQKANVIFSGPADEQGKVTINTVLPEYGFYRFNLDNGKTTFFIIAGPGEKITFTTHADNIIGRMNIKGSSVNEKYLKVKYHADSIRAIQSQLEQQHKQLSSASGNDAALKDIVERYNQLQSERLSAIRKFMNDNHQSLAVLFFTEDIKLEDEPVLYDKISASLIKEYPDNFFVKDLNWKVESDKRTRIGSVAPDIALPNPDGDTIRLSSLRGNIVLLDFWAAWCGPCRRENPNLVRIYEKYKDKGFEIYGVSLDRDRASWLRGINEDKLTWTLVSDLKYWSSAPAQLYGVKSIPYAILLDRDGNIIAKRVRAHELEKMLADIFDETEK